MELPEHTSASQLSTYASCAKKYSLRYLEGAERENTSVGLVLGSAVHAALGWWHDRKLLGHMPTLDDALRVAEADTQASLDGPPVEWGRWTEPDFREHTNTMVRFAISTLGDMPVRATEARFTLPLIDPNTGRRLPRPLLGYYDFVLEGGRIVELKTGRAEYNDTNVRTSIQFAAYLTAMAEHRSAKALDLEILVKTKQPKLQRITLVPSPEIKQWFYQTAAAIEGAIAAGHFPPSPGFGCGYCEYKRQCLGSAEVAYGQAA
ncbi:MAG: PD-(D/E)XK nuclease family protein [Sandaracinaceae bacterium]|nr:PD-(D/E)XK nuclease family protein [Sandaracinaceae bacterium]